MSIVTLQLGQCGNQVGSAFFSRLASEVSSGSKAFATDAAEAFFSETEGKNTKYAARAVLVDMEPKVIASTLSSTKGGIWTYGDKAWYARDSGSGNNWARGYYGNGPHCKSTVLNLIRRQVEACDNFGGFLTLQSLAGGTGSGLGAYLASALREEYPNCCLLSHCIWPFETGEVVVQSYNVLLSLAHILQAADGVIVVGNEALHATCQRQLSMSRPTFGAMNQIAADSLAAAFLPAQKRPLTGPSQETKPAHGKVRMLSDVVSLTCPSPLHRLLSLRSVPHMELRAREFTTFSWPPLLRRLRQMLITGSMLEQGMDWNRSLTPLTVEGRPLCKSVSNLLTLRGKGCFDADVSMFSDPGLYAKWNVDPLLVTAQSAVFAQTEMTATLLSNCQAIVGPLERMLSRAYALFDDKAYVHQFEWHGLEQATLAGVLAQVEDVLASYRSL